mgnify:CR=1 FL=1
MRPSGFSTGAIARGDFRRGLALTHSAGCKVVELSALRQNELEPLIEAIPEMDLGEFEYVSVHAPSVIHGDKEAETVSLISTVIRRGWPIVVHPDALTRFALWRGFGKLLCIENMDKRKPIGRTAAELTKVFAELPEATFCFDIGHARQVDPTMTEAYLLLKQFGPRLRQVHVSEVNTASRHDRLSFTSQLAFQEIAHLIPEQVPLVLETPLTADKMQAELEVVRKTFGPRARVA